MFAATSMDWCSHILDCNVDSKHHKPMNVNPYSSPFSSPDTGVSRSGWRWIPVIGFGGFGLLLLMVLIARSIEFAGLVLALDAASRASADFREQWIFIALYLVLAVPCLLSAFWFYFACYRRAWTSALIPLLCIGFWIVGGFMGWLT